MRLRPKFGNAVSGNVVIALFLGLLVGALVGGFTVHLAASKSRYHGIPAPLVGEDYYFNRGTVSAFQTYSGVWINGFEDSRFFPNVRSVPTDRMPETTSRLLMAEAAGSLIYRFMAKPVQPGCSDVLAITFKGNAVKLNHSAGMPGYIETIYVPREVLSVSSLRHIC